MFKRRRTSGAARVSGDAGGGNHADHMCIDRLSADAGDARRLYPKTEDILKEAILETATALPEVENATQPACLFG